MLLDADKDVVINREDCRLILSQIPIPGASSLSSLPRYFPIKPQIRVTSEGSSGNRPHPGQLLQRVDSLDQLREVPHALK